MFSKNEICSLLDRDWDIIVLFYYGRSGSMFLNNLLDGHPKLISPSPELFQAAYPYFIQTYTAFERPNVFSKEKIKSLFNSISKIPTWKKYFDSAKFTSTINNLIFIFDYLTRRDLVILLNIAFHTYYHGRDNIPTKIVFQMHGNDPIHVRKLIQDMASYRYIHMVRKPLESYTSHLWSHWDMLPPKNFLTNAICNSGLPSFPSITNKSKALRLEELKSLPKETMSMVAEHIEVPWNDSLLIPTINGNICDSIFATPKTYLEQLSDKAVNDWPWFQQKSTSSKKPALFTPEESEAIEIALYPYYKSWNYSPEWISIQNASLLHNEKKAIQQFDKNFTYRRIANDNLEEDSNKIFQEHILKRQKFGRDAKPVSLLTTNDSLFF